MIACAEQNHLLNSPIPCTNSYVLPPKDVNQIIHRSLRNNLKYIVKVGPVSVCQSPPLSCPLPSDCSGKRLKISLVMILMREHFMVNWECRVLLLFLIIKCQANYLVLKLQSPTAGRILLSLLRPHRSWIKIKILTHLVLGCPIFGGWCHPQKRYHTPSSWITVSQYLAQCLEASRKYWMNAWLFMQEKWGFLHPCRVG